MRNGKIHLFYVLVTVFFLLNQTILETYGEAQNPAVTENLGVDVDRIQVKLTYLGPQEKVVPTVAFSVRQFSLENFEHYGKLSETLYQNDRLVLNYFRVSPEEMERIYPVISNFLEKEVSPPYYLSLMVYYPESGVKEAVLGIEEGLTLVWEITKSLDPGNIEGIESMKPLYYALGGEKEIGVEKNKVVKKEEKKECRCISLPKEFGSKKAGRIDTKTKNNEIGIEYKPSCVEDCEKLVFIQTVCRTAVVDPAIEIPYWPSDESIRWGRKDEDTVNGGIFCTVDYIICERDPYYNGDDKADGNKKFGIHKCGKKTKTSTMSDAPRSPTSSFQRLDKTLIGRDPRLGEKKVRVNKIVKEFETCAYCAKSKDFGTFYGCVSWKYEISRKEAENGKLGRVSVTEKTDKPSHKFEEALQEWVKTRKKCKKCEEKYSSTCKVKETKCKPKIREKIEKRIYITPQGERKTCELRERFGDTYVLLDGEGTPIGVYLPVEAEELRDEEASPSGGYLLEPPWDFERGHLLTDLPKLKPRPSETEIPGYTPVEEETPPESGITYTSKEEENGEVVEEESRTFVPEGETYTSCGKVEEVVETPCPTPKEGYYLAGYHKYEHGDGAKEVEGFGLAAPSNKGYEEIIFADKYTIVCIYEPLESLEELLPKFTEEDCPEPKPGYYLAGWSRVVNHQLVESKGKERPSERGYEYVKSRTVVRDCVPVIDEVLTCVYEPIELEIIPLEEAIRRGLIELEGQDTAWGEIFKVKKSPEGKTVTLPPYTPLVPSEEEDKYQKMITSNSEEIELKEGDTIEGYCLDAFKDPPAPGVKYEVGEVSDKERIVAIIEAGVDLYLKGELDQEFMPPEEYLDFVVQQAIWVYIEGLSKEDVQENLEAILEIVERQTGRRLLRWQKSQFLERVWEDIQKTLREAGMGDIGTR